MSVSDKKFKRERALYKLGNQLSVLSRTATGKQKDVVAEMSRLYGEL